MEIESRIQENLEEFIEDLIEKSLNKLIDSNAKYRELYKNREDLYLKLYNNEICNEELAQYKQMSIELTSIENNYLYLQGIINFKKLMAFLTIDI